MEEGFELTDDDVQAIEIAKNTARRFLKHPLITPKQSIALGNALYALERLPLITPGSSSEFGIVNHATVRWNRSHTLISDYIVDERRQFRYLV
ncbi:hypothetical protein B188_22940 [Candidatus Brocadiaceae bacterium B188]|nr:hypothetical protein [Candidatus Brocadia sapporoensis]QQR67272.1 MAG: hypothetical protein IPI25_03315 [Candidatus Brocadia sp.]RZV56290.1 MAG: hypothetical protein EX330_13865 [Candidatus Brocadia sp. BROELEC01]TWU54298.1 hypothetical protein B188_22940 [Candidatus Brocadiaceae bacterium B188]